ncbi:MULTISPECIES: GNAT family N-acetyltransferase [Bradyrhizobium]|jgi:GNAT superfamily N-acetyltransferase|uniref:GNAT family N-acetyltransferase n=2 Tax=Bradyrhizobium TaxID=374 RepID=A0A2U8PEE5_9BRAD|nr:MULTISPECIES: GNAT family N-acetyltransferase [Bradyrhizobium]AWL96109.1 GNAT family N-acetyltransferase [Bradyrhizobium ottawaense]MBR1328841.1 GNAT family N-acetyltransferase [Bradyrhizobium ottawaense]MBR1334936.1 GNAT family N-acetyltransferase [Bradyrhizobium ottawaense]MBR1362949.1 GNAT family N-acetyltransferase [Bradyrhizobium ottawaense]MDA9450319.1 GCN5 family acetyltransferase [Bradyrhizobium sp. CCBAU 21360]
MSDAANYARNEQLRDGTAVEIRALRPDDQAAMLAALGEVGTQSLQRRFFMLKRHFSEKERAFFVEVDFKDHVALVACVANAGRSTIVGGARYVAAGPGCAETAFMVIDAWQGRGIGGLLLRHLISLAREARLKELTAEVLPDNAAMLSLLGRFGFERAERREADTVHMVLTLT